MHSPLYIALLLILFATLTTGTPLNSETVCLSQPAFICALRPTATNQVQGTVLFTPYFRTARRNRKCILRVQATIYNLTPGPHGFHIHTYGDVTAPDGSAAGGHFTNSRMDPLPHGYPDDRPRHWGDLGNVTANESGTAAYDRVDAVARYRAVLGRSIIVHALPDMGPEFQPSGASGPRQAQCVIGFANPASVEDFLG